MAIEGHAFGLPGVGGGAGALAGRVGEAAATTLVEAAHEVADAAAEIAQEIGADAAEVVAAVGTAIGAASVVKSPVDVQSVLVDELKKIVPGSKLDGDWKLPQVETVIAILAELPKPLLPMFHGITFEILPWDLAARANRGGSTVEEEEQEQKQRMIQTDAARRLIRIREEAFGLPDVGGVQGFKLALVGELGKVAAAKPGNASAQEFAKLSGWTMTVRTPEGRVVEGPKPTAGALPGETKPAGMPASLTEDPAVPTWDAGGMGSRGVSRPAAGTQRLQPQETGRLRPGEDARRAPGTSILPPGAAAVGGVVEFRGPKGEAPTGRGRTGDLPAGPAPAARGGPGATGNLPGGRSGPTNGTGTASPPTPMHGATASSVTGPSTASRGTGAVGKGVADGGTAGRGTPVPGAPAARGEGPGTGAIARGAVGPDAPVARGGAAQPAAHADAEGGAVAPVEGHLDGGAAIANHEGETIAAHADGDVQATDFEGADAAPAPTPGRAPAARGSGPLVAEPAHPDGHGPAQPGLPAAVPGAPAPTSRGPGALSQPAAPGAPAPNGRGPAALSQPGAIPAAPAGSGPLAQPAARGAGPLGQPGAPAPAARAAGTPAQPSAAVPNGSGPLAPAAGRGAGPLSPPGADMVAHGAEGEHLAAHGPDGQPIARHAKAAPGGEAGDHEELEALAEGEPDPAAARRGAPGKPGDMKGLAADGKVPAKPGDMKGLAADPKGASKPGDAKGQPSDMKGLAADGKAPAKPGDAKGAFGATAATPPASGKPGALAASSASPTRGAPPAAAPPTGTGDFGARSAPGTPKPGAGPLRPDTAGLPARGPGGQPAPARGGATPSGPLGATSTGPRGSGALGATSAGPRALSNGPRGPQGAGATATAAPPRPIPVDGGSQVALKDNKVAAFSHDPAAEPTGHAHDPRADFGESLKAFMFKPEALLAKAPGKFLFLNAETRQYSQAQVQAMAKAAGLDLGAVVTDMLVAGRATQATVNRICDAHGLAADAAALRAKDQQTLARGANLEGLTARLALDLGANGPATAKAVREAELLLASYDKLASKLPVTKDPTRVGLPAGNGVFAWIATRAAQLGEGRASKVEAELSEIRAQFQRLPLAAQLKVDPKLALGAGWFRLAPEERALLASPQGVQGLVARATERVDEVGYIPQRLNASEKRALATQTLVETLFDPGVAGQLLRAKLGAVDPKAVPGGVPRPQDLPGALKELTARNGEAVFELLGEDQKKALGDRKALASLKEAMADPALAAAIATLRRDATGAEALRTTILQYALSAGKQEGDLMGAIQGAIASIRAEQLRFTKALDGGALELALTEVNRQVQDGNTDFVARFVADRPDALEDALGPWVTQGLSPAEKKLLEDADYRRHLVADAQTQRATGASLAEEARQFRVETENLQQTLDFLTRPDQAFRREFEKDPVAALQRRGIYQHLPDPVKIMLAEGERLTQVQHLTKAVEQAIAPIIQRQIGHQKQVENLKAAIKTVNAGNYKPILGVLDLGEAEMNRAVKATLGSAMNSGERELKTGIVDFL